MNKEYQLKNLKDTEKLAKQLVKQLKGGEVVGLVGDLGSGKTTLVQFLAKVLEVKHVVNSPTFVLMKVYDVAKPKNKIKKLIHVDAYRLIDGAELKNIGLEEYLGREDCVVVIEWADQVTDLLPAGTLMVRFVQEEAGGTRRVMISREI